MTSSSFVLSIMLILLRDVKEGVMGIAFGASLWIDDYCCRLGTRKVKKEWKIIWAENVGEEAKIG